jgi:signal transduction histidine kinase
MIIMTHVQATGDYVREILRPAITSALERLNAKDEFVIEAMSTTHISHQIMERFNKKLSGYVFKRVSDNPMNPKNRADFFHLEMLSYFRQNKDETSWNGIVDLEGKKYLFLIRPVIMETGCLRCHGKPDDAPKELVKRYGTSGGFGWEMGSVVGLNSVSAPMDIAFAEIKKVAFDTFLFGISTLGLLFLTLFGIFRHMVTKPLNSLSDTFRNIAEGREPLGKNIPIKSKDEIGDLTESFNVLSTHLLDAQERLKKTAQIEKQMMETEKLASLGQLAAGVAHEINNPLGGIKLCFNNLLKTQMDENKRRQHIDVINSGLDRIQNIVKHLLDFSKNSQLNIAPHSINKIIEDTLSLTEYTISKNNIKLVKMLSPDIPDLMVDSNKLEQVFLNLIINAVQAMSPDSETEILQCKNGHCSLTIKTWLDDHTCYISFSDTGKGIPLEVLPKIFDPFFTTKGVGEGTGLGLTVSKSIIEQHKGEITVYTSDKGTIFTIKLPVTNEKTHINN